jgi:hypothetical protein
MQTSKVVGKLLETTGELLSRKRKADAAIRLMGADLEEIVDALEAAVAPEDRPLLAEIDRQIEDYGERQPDRMHGFLEWVLLLHKGSRSLPERIPADLLRTWRDGYSERWGFDGSPRSLSASWRCEDCKMALPNAGPNGTLFPSDCPVCGSVDLRYADLSRPIGERWIARDAYHGEAS